MHSPWGLSLLGCCHPYLGWVLAWLSRVDGNETWVLINANDLLGWALSVPEQQVARDDGPRYWSDAYPERKRVASPVRLAGGFYSGIAFPGFFLSYTSLSPSQIASPCWQTSSLAISLLKGISVSKADVCTSAWTIFLSQHCRKGE